MAIGESSHFENQAQLLQKPIDTNCVDGLGWLCDLANEQYDNFKIALGAKAGHRMTPNREIRIATCCTGSGAEVFTLVAVLDTFR